MELIISQLQNWSPSNRGKAGRLDERLSNVLSAFAGTLVSLGAPMPLSAQVSAALRDGMQAVQEAALGSILQGNGNWTFSLEPCGPVNAVLSLRRDPPGELEMHFQVDNQNRPHGLFYLANLEQEILFYFSVGRTGWVLCKRQDLQEMRFPLDPSAGSALAWNPSPHFDFMDGFEAVQAEGLGSWLAKFEINPPAEESAPVQGIPSAQPVPGYAPRAEKVCPNCGKPVNPQARFCRACGTPLAEVKPEAQPDRCCPHCGGAVSAKARFCGSCGKTLG